MSFLLWMCFSTSFVLLKRTEVSALANEYSISPNSTVESEKVQSILSSYPCPKGCNCWFNTDPDRVDVACRLESLDERFVDFSVLNGTTVSSRLLLYCNKKSLLLSRIADSVFESLHAFYYIKIKGCHLTNISRYAFKGLNSLNTLIIEGGKHIQVDHDCLQLPELWNLEVVSFTGSGLSAAPSMCNLDKLWLVNLSRNSIETFAETGLLCESQTNVICIDVSDNKLNLPEKFATVTGKLKRLSAPRNRISHITKTLFENLTDIEIIDLRDNKIFPFPEDFLGNNDKIHTLQLAHNIVGQLPKGVFSKLGKLTLLDLNEMALSDDIWAELNTLVNLQVLYMNDNDITILNSTALRQLKRLGILELSRNFIKEIPDGIFEFQNQLLSLEMAGNKLMSIYRNSFEGLQKLSNLDLKANQIGNIHMESLSHLSSLKQLNLSHIQIQTLPQFPASLISLDMRVNRVKNIAYGSFTGLTNLIGVNLMKNRISYLPRNVFKTNSNLKLLQLAYNNLVTVDYHIFPALSNLEMLVLDHNNISDIGSYPDDFFPDLKTIDLSYNNIRFVVSGLTGDLFPTSIEDIFLSWNKIEFIDNFIFELPNLKYVDLRMNQISNLSNLALEVSTGKLVPVAYSLRGNPFNCDCHLAWIKDFTSIHRDISDAQYIIKDFNSLYCYQIYRQQRDLLKNIPSEKFLCKYEVNCFPRCQCCFQDRCPCRLYCPVNCTCYRSNNWSADVVDCLDARLTSIPVNMSITITTLDLSGNYFSTISPRDFEDLIWLQELFLNSSHISSVMEGSFKKLSNLTLLDLGHNLLYRLTSEIFQGLYNLQKLTLSFNNISEISEKTFDSLKSLKHLYIEGNNLKTLSSFEFKSMAKIMSLTLSKNPWSCECRYLEKMKNFTLTYAHHIRDFADVVCILRNSSSNVTEEYPLANVKLPDFCRNETVIYNQTSKDSKILDEAAIVAMSTLFSIFVLGIIVFGILFWNREFLKVWCFVKFGWKFGHAEDKDEANRPYDAFVSYSSLDEDFVVRELVPYLEAERQGKPGYKLCVHFRDFVVGASIAESIIAAVERSRRVIIILSENFLNSEWCQYEFQTAHHQLLEERKSRIIMILLHEINFDLEDHQLKDYLKTRTYLKYGDPWFWPKLEYAMPKLKQTANENVGTDDVGPQPDIIPHQYRENEAYIVEDDNDNEMQYIIDNMRNLEADDPKLFVFEEAVG